MFQTKISVLFCTVHML